MRRWRTRSPEETRELGARLAAEVRPHGTLLLSGDLGAGKTVLVQGVAAGLGIDPAEVQSPTFTLVREHVAGDARLLHVDLYRLDAREAAAIGLEEELAGAGVKVVEWAERLDFPVAGALKLEIRRVGDGDERLVLERPPDEAGDDNGGSKEDRE